MDSLSLTPEAERELRAQMMVSATRESNARFRAGYGLGLSRRSVKFARQLACLGFPKHPAGLGMRIACTPPFEVTP